MPQGGGVLGRAAVFARFPGVTRDALACRAVGLDHGGVCLTALWLADPIPPAVTHGSVRRTRFLVDVAILHLITNPAVLHETMLIGIFGAPRLHETAPSNDGHSIHQLTLMLGLFCPDRFPLLGTRRAFKRLKLVTKVGFPILDAWPAPLGERLEAVASRTTLRRSHCGGLAGFHLYRALDGDISASDRDGVVLDVHFLRILH